MNCSRKTMINLALVMGVVLVAAYFALPQFHALVLGIAPFLLVLLCPLSMFFMMRGMGSHNQAHDEKAETGQATKSVTQKNLEK
ncbi:DUF2933 domain-containing protein [Pandoraea sp. XJJ-1]|jgi:hypothetical protein|uniref:DUF2933 domain-containing protein n=2 Tax=Pandoraea TaxID=93217 RepID=A0A5E5P904_9BURK|nr:MULTISPECIES: DUF2933 domain-containing protein [Pandoraea]MBN9096342.1 DUF2933 domain-containing protein [Pandoraea pnomenusa]OXS88437.1 hypothetical protein B7H01_22035 [Pandoraea apista]PTD98391.1 DUF2933 domain-containing protein [Pandoraea apista]QBC31810.1 DUF2933 domain-containing protein [Pandoraea sp. XY-2]RSC97897.1 DUF2933 domain-containing protein [Pandoraea apista]